MRVLDQHNAVYQIPTRLAIHENGLRRRLLMQEARRMARFEVASCQKFDKVVWVIRQDYEAVRDQAGGSSGHIPCSAVIPICGDSEPKFRTFQIE